MIIPSRRRQQPRGTQNAQKQNGSAGSASSASSAVIRRRFAAIVAIGAAVFGGTAALAVARAGLTLSHYDARGHLVVARRVADSLTPGWQQIGAVWLPLPHLLNAVPVQIDLLFRTGASGVVISVLAFAIAAASIGWIVSRITESLWAAAAAVFVFAINPNVLYLQSTPMTEPLLLGLSLLAVALLVEWCAVATEDVGAELARPRADQGRPLRSPTRIIGIVFALACMTRYEAWPVTASALMGAVWARHGAADTWTKSIRDVSAVAVYPAGAIAAFLVFSRVVIGEWFVAGGFFVPENVALGRPLLAAGQLLTGVRALGGTLTTVIAIVGLMGLFVRGVIRSTGAHALVALSPLAAAALPWLAFVEGHPHRVRYMVPLLAAQAIGIGAAAARWRRATPAAALTFILIAAIEIAPTYGAPAMVAESAWDLPNAAERAKVTACLAAQYDGATVMASMGSLGHYMQELSRAGFRLRDFLHEGNGDLWLAAIVRARPFAGWVLVEEYAEGGDMLAALARENPRFLDGFSRACEGGGVALYRRH